MKKVAGFQSLLLFAFFSAFALARSATETGSLACRKALGMRDAQMEGLATRGEKVSSAEAEVVCVNVLLGRDRGRVVDTAGRVVAL